MKKVAEDKFDEYFDNSLYSSNNCDDLLRSDEELLDFDELKE